MTNTVGDFELLTGSSTPLLAAGDVVRFVDVDDPTQAPQGSLVRATLTQFFAAIPVAGYFNGAGAASAYLSNSLVSNVQSHVVRAAAEPAIRTVRVNGTLAAPTAVLTTQALGRFQAYGYGASALKDGPFIQMTSTENWSNTASGSKMVFYTVPNTTISPAIALTLGQDQSVTVTCATASAFAVGLAGATNSAFVVDSSTALQAAGLKV